ncbi:protein NUCLEAR FUSION DEFECTIVE 6, mitochondrial-like isoform X2 [Apium graveolens]|uniref:protein NUCLEAR FUSION DEFECTIVE 6, mitochondrial-like isoform X2 n=1 Tax=Apium graveolens TaxID=4045 RepID=UPI003D7B4EEF
MSSCAAARSILRSATLRNATARIASATKTKAAPSPSPFRMPTRKPSLSTRLFSCPVEMSSMQPYHTATASALMTSMLTLSRVGYGWLPEACNDDV